MSSIKFVYYINMYVYKNIFIIQKPDHQIRHSSFNNLTRQAKSCLNVF